MSIRCFCELNVYLDESELFARPRVAGHYSNRSTFNFSHGVYINHRFARLGYLMLFEN